MFSLQHLLRESNISKKKKKKEEEEKKKSKTPLFFKDYWCQLFFFSRHHYSLKNFGGNYFWHHYSLKIRGRHYFWHHFSLKIFGGNFFFFFWHWPQYRWTFDFQLVQITCLNPTCTYHCQVDCGLLVVTSGWPRHGQVRDLLSPCRISMGSIGEGPFVGHARTAVRGNQGAGRMPF